MQATAVPACFIQRADPDAAGSYGYWDETEASYAGTVEKLKQQAKEQLSGSALVGGAAVTEVRAELEGKIEESGENHISLWVDCDSGKTYQLTGDITFSHTSIMISVDIRCVPIGLQTTPI